MGLLNKVAGFLHNLNEKVSEMAEQEEKKVKEKLNVGTESQFVPEQISKEEPMVIAETETIEEEAMEEESWYEKEIAGFPTVPIEIAYKVRAEWFAYFAEQGDPMFQKELAYCYWDGTGVEQNYEKARDWIKKAAEQGDPESCYKYGLLLSLDGTGLPTDLKEARKWIEKAAELEYPDALSLIGFYYESGAGGEQNIESAIKWYKKAAEFEDAAAMYKLGIFYLKGIGVAQDEKMAITWLRESAKYGDEDAKSALRVCGIYS